MSRGQSGHAQRLRCQSSAARFGSRTHCVPIAASFADIAVSLMRASMAIAGIFAYSMK